MSAAIEIFEHLVRQHTEAESRKDECEREFERAAEKKNAMPANKDFIEEYEACASALKFSKWRESTLYLAVSKAREILSNHMK